MYILYNNIFTKFLSRILSYKHLNTSAFIVSFFLHLFFLNIDFTYFDSIFRPFASDKKFFSKRIIQRGE